MRPSQLFSTALAFSVLSVAWPWPQSWEGHNPMREIEGIMVRRQASSSNNAASSEASSAAASGASSAASSGANPQSSAASGGLSGSGFQTSSPAASTGASGSTQGSSQTGSARATGSGSGTNTGSVNSGTRTSSPKTTTFDARLPAGGIAMITPNALAGSQYYKVGNFITFAWNYTSLSVTPSAIDILATCKKNQAMYTLALNQTVRPTGEIVWDTGSYQASETPQLLTEVYTLIIHDAAKDTTAAPQAGYLATFNTFQFAMYSPQIYTPLADGIQCATCSGALSAMERQTLSFLFGMGALTVLSFMWFAGGWGLLY